MIERIDMVVGRLVEAASAAIPGVTVAVVSDHGFAPTTTEANLFRPFIDAGLITLDPAGKISGWEAMPWNSGGSIAVVLARPGDAALTAKVRALLDDQRRRPGGFVARVIDRAGIDRMGGNPDAQFYVDLKPGFLAGNFEGAATPVTRPARYKGMHGYFPDMPAMRSTFIVAGPGIAAGRDLGEIDMRAIAPTLARVLGFRLDSAESPALDIGLAPAAE